MRGESKISFTHIIAYAIVKALKANPTLNHAFAEKDGELFRVVRPGRESWAWRSMWPARMARGR